MQQGHDLTSKIASSSQKHSQPLGNDVQEYSSSSSTSEGSGDGGIGSSSGDGGGSANTRRHGGWSSDDGSDGPKQSGQEKQQQLQQAVFLLAALSGALLVGVVQLVLSGTAHQRLLEALQGGQQVRHSGYSHQTLPCCDLPSTNICITVNTQFQTAHLSEPAGQHFLAVFVCCQPAMFCQGSPRPACRLPNLSSNITSK